MRNSRQIQESRNLELLKGAKLFGVEEVRHGAAARGDGSLFPFCLQLLRSTRNVTQRSHGDPEARHRNLDRASIRWFSLGPSQRSRCRHRLNAQAHQVRPQHIAPFVHQGCKIILGLMRCSWSTSPLQTNGSSSESMSPKKERFRFDKLGSGRMREG